MVSPGKLRLLTALSEDSLEELRPTIDEETGTVVYPDAKRRLDRSDGPVIEVLEELADHDLLVREFQEKVYICPQCETEGMQYTTVCPSCESPHTIQTEKYRHPTCDFEGVREQFADGDAVTCPNCDASLESLEDLETGPANVCENCATVFEMPEHRLRCRECRHAFPPRETIEQVLYQYYLSERGARWVDEQQTARQRVAEIFEERSLATEIDATVTDGAGEDVPVHVYAKDELLDDRVVAGVHERPTEDDVRQLRETAAALDARATLVTTSGEIVGDDVGTLLSDEELTVLSLSGDTLQREFQVTDEAGATDSFVGRIAGILRPQRR